jgi:trans-2,3-dihydro-3-hydroxyanthranilate isomerase
LAVVHDANGVDEATMLAFARETQLSETTFVQSASAAGATYRNRIWTTGRELDFAGHPSLGTAVAEALRRGERSARYVQQTRAGLQPVEVEVAADGRSAHAEMLQEPARFADAPAAGAIAQAVGLELSDLHGELAPQVVSTGLAHLVVPLASEAALDRAAPRSAAVVAQLLGDAATTVYLAAVGEDGRGATRSFFVPQGAIVEDPATGSAVGPLCAYLHRHAGIDAISVTQGVQMGRPSRLRARVEGDRVRVGGDIVVLVTGEVTL